MSESGNKETQHEINLRLIRLSVERDADIAIGTHISFRRMDHLETGVTKVFQVRTLEADFTGLGYVRWFGRWRKYSFFPEANMVFEGTCMREITCFIEALTARHLELRKVKKANA